MLNKINVKMMIFPLIFLYSITRYLSQLKVYRGGSVCNLKIVFKFV